MKLSFTLVCLLYSLLLIAQPGTLDKSFGNEGKTTFRFDAKDDLAVYGSAVQANGKIIIVGKITNPNIDYGDFLVARFTRDGFIDSSFGRNGYAYIKFTTVNAIEAHGVCVQADQKIIVVGYSTTGLLDTDYKGIIARFNSDGSPDASFGENGTVVSSYSDDNTYQTVAVKPDGKIITGGKTSNKILLNCYFENGTPDVSFGENGSAIYESSIASSILIQKDNKILIGGTSYSGQSTTMQLLRYLENGTLDLSFGISGVIKTDYGLNNDNIAQIALQKDGKIIAVGVTGVLFDAKDAKMACARYTINGMLDSSFGVNGKSTLFFEDSSAFGTSVAIQQNDKILLAGYVSTSEFSNDFVVRLSKDGIQDSSFGVNGKSFTSITGFDSPTGVFLQPDDKIVIAGMSYANNHSTGYISLTRFNNDDLSKKQIIIKKIKHYLATHNNAQAVTLNDVSIYPNPAQNILHVVGLSSNKTTLTVINFMGNVKLQTVANTSSYNLNIATLIPGNYLLKIEMNDAVVTKKFVKQ